MRVEFGYGKTVQTADIPDRNLLGILKANEVALPADEQAEVRRAIENPTGSPRLKDIVRSGEKIAVITSDITRPMPTARVLPALLEELFAAGVNRQDITVIFGLGSHRPHTADEHKRLLGGCYGTIACADSGANGFVHLGATSRGTPVDIDKTVAEADRRVCLGNIEYHYFAGYSGGAKALMPGVSTRQAIQSNHSRMVEPTAAAGILDGNPVRGDIEEAAGFCPIDFILNVILDEHKNIAAAFAGDVKAAHREGCAFLDKLYRIRLPRKADIVIASQGGHPKDINLYQTQKALDNAMHAVNDGGIVILAGACTEGLGERVFEQWMLNYTPDEMIRRIRKDFVLGGHKAAAIALALKRARVFLVSELAPDFVTKIHLEPFSTVQQALDKAFEQLGSSASVLAMPYAGATLPYCE